MRGRDIVVWGAVGVGLLLVVPSIRDGCGAPAVRRGDRAPRFSLVLVGSGESRDSASLNGRPYALLFFATWCGSCRSEMPELARVLHERPSLRLYAVSDEPGERVVRYLASSGLALPAAGDAGGVFASFGVRAVPTMVVVNEQGVVEFARAGSNAVTEGIRRLEDLDSRVGASKPARPPAPTRNPEDEGWQASGGLMGCLRDQEGGKHVNRMSCHDTPSTVDNAETARTIPSGGSGMRV